MCQLQTLLNRKGQGQEMKKIRNKEGEKVGVIQRLCENKE